MRRWLFVAFTVVIALCVVKNNAFAAEGVTISPPFQNITITKDQQTADFSYSVTNNDPSQTKTFTLSTSDFGSLDESGGVAFLASTPGQIRPHGLVNWLTLSDSTVTLRPGEVKTMRASINNQPSLTPGGHYGAILLGEQPTAAASKDKVIVQSVLSTLLFVNKIGGEKYDLKLDSVQPATDWWQTLSLKARFHNKGNIDVVPRGVIRLLDPRGREVARAAINEESSRILPDSFRRFTVPLMTTRRISAPGKYQLVVQYRYDGRDNFTTYKTSLYYIPRGALILLAAIILGLTVVTSLGVFIYKRQLRQKHQKSD